MTGFLKRYFLSLSASHAVNCDETVTSSIFALFCGPLVTIKILKTKKGVSGSLFNSILRILVIILQVSDELVDMWTNFATHKHPTPRYNFWIWLSLSCVPWCPGTVYPFVICTFETRVQTTNLTRSQLFIP